MKWRTRPASREGRGWRGWLGRAVDSAGRSLKAKLTAGARCQRRLSGSESARSAGWAGLRAFWLGLAQFQNVFPFSFLFKNA